MKLSQKQLEAIKGAIAHRISSDQGFDTHAVTIMANIDLVLLKEPIITPNQVRGVWASICQKRKRQKP